MNSEWPVFTVEKLVSREILAPPIDGNHGSIHPKACDFLSEGVPFIMASDLIHGRIDLKRCAFLDRVEAKKLRKGFAKAGDVLLSHKATIGRTALVQESEFDHIILTPQVTYYRILDSSQLENRYLKYYFDSEAFQKKLIAWAGSGSTRLYLGITAQRKLPIVCPPIQIQKSISSVLASFDERIENLRETNATLESIAQTLFKSWFVDFDPVHAKAEGRLPEGMDAETAALFPDSFEESELGLVPKGWQHVSLREVVNIFDSQRAPLSSQERQKRKGVFSYYGAAALMDYIDDYLFDGIYILVGEDGSVIDSNGSPITQYVWGKIWVNNHAHVLQGANGISTEHLLLAFKNINVSPYITGAVQAKLSQSNMWRILFLRPSQTIIQCFNEMISPLFEKLRHNSEELKNLTKIRDFLLPRLISGRLKLPRVEKIFKEALSG